MPRRQLLAATLASAIEPGPAPSTLRQRAAARGVLFGSMIESRRLAADPAYAATIARECAVVAPGIEAKFASTEPADGRFAFSPLEDCAAFAKQRSLGMRLHNLVWGVWNPPWVANAIAEGRGRLVMERHIAKVVGQMRGRGFAWDVLNEPADPRWPSGREGLCRTGWWNAMGPEFAEHAFHAAHEADPAALLFVNDDWLEYPQCAAKRTVYLKLLESWLKRSVPVHGFGIEAHLQPDQTFDAVPYRRFLSELAAMGLVIHVTELDVTDRSLAADIGERDRIVADHTSRFLDVVLDEPAVRAVLVWGLSDRAGDLDRDARTRRTDGLPARGTPLDARLRRKPMYHAIGNAFDHARTRA